MKVVVVDIDGTVSQVHPERLKYIQRDKKYWDKFYELCYMDTPITPIINLIQLLAREYHIIFCTGRREGVRKKTEAWLQEFLKPMLGFTLLMRPNGNLNQDIEVKPRILYDYISQLEEATKTSISVEFIIEDRNSMVKKWRELGYTCLQVAEGDL